MLCGRVLRECSWCQRERGKHGKQFWLRHDHPLKNYTRLVTHNGHSKKGMIMLPAQKNQIYGWVVANLMNAPPLKTGDYTAWQ